MMGLGEELGLPELEAGLLELHEILVLHNDEDIKRKLLVHDSVDTGGMDLTGKWILHGRSRSGQRNHKRRRVSNRRAKNES